MSSGPGPADAVPPAAGMGRAAVSIRRATVEDFDRVAALTVDAYRAASRLAVGHGYEKVLADVPSRAAAAEVLVAGWPGAEDGGIVGTVTFVLPGTPYAELCGPGEAEFRMLAVDPLAQGRGIGEALVRACLDRARALSARAVRLSTTPFLVAANRLYERLGFVRTPELDWSPAAGVDLLAFRFDLPRAGEVSAHEVEGDVERGGPALVVGDVGVADDEPAGVQSEDRQR